jgi:hypothetical protein
MKHFIGGETMFIFIAGLFVGSLAMLFTMSLMFAAKRGDMQIEAFINEKSSTAQTVIPSKF